MAIEVLIYSFLTSSLSGGWRSMEVNATTLHFKIGKKPQKQFYRGLAESRTFLDDCGEDK
jgi:hypothetical protein